MGMLDVQNLYGKTLEIQSLFQQSMGQSELALRQAEKNLAAERARRESQIEQGEESAEARGNAMDLGLRSPVEKYRRYRLAWRGGQGPAVEIEINMAEPFRRRLDLNA